MNKKALIIIETRKNRDVEFWQEYMFRVGEDMPKLGEIDTNARDPNTALFYDSNLRDRFVQNEMAWYNIDNIKWPTIPALLDKGGEHLHGNEDETCEEAGACVCGPISWATYDSNVYVKKINYHLLDPIVFYEEEHPAYLARLEYCKEHDITVEIMHVDLDDHWHSDLEYFDHTKYVSNGGSSYISTGGLNG